MSHDEKSGDQSLTESQIREVRAAISKEVTDCPPTIGMVGVSGVGKSSSLNRLFRTDLPTSPTVACTKEFISKDLSVSMQRAEAAVMEVQLRVIDAPGLGEDFTKDDEYLKMYSESLSSCDVILWIMTARNRAVALDQMYLQRLQGQHARIVFGINQVDLVHPLNWNKVTNLPSEEQEQNIRDIAVDRQLHIQRVFRGDAKVIPYSAETGYNLEELFHFLIDACPETRRWIFAGLKNFSYMDFIPADILEVIKNESREP